MNTEQERAAFEAFASKHGLCVTEGGDLYRSHVVAWMWKAWQARAALQSQDYANIFRTLAECRDIAMEWTMRGRIPECGKFGEIAQNLDAVCAEEFRAALRSQDREDAERYRYLSSMATQQADALGPIFRIDVRRTPQTLFNFDAAVDHARRIEGEGE